MLGLVVFGYLWPVLVGGKILSPLADLYGNAPWRFQPPSDWSRYINPTLFDVPLAHYPWRLLVRDLLREGTLPMWNPYVFSGIPLFSNPQTGLFSPFNLPLWMLPLTYAVGVSAALKLLTGAFGTYLLARQLRLGLLPGLLAGIAFAFCSANIVWLTHDTLPGVLVMAPWAIWLVERIFEHRRLTSATGLAIVVAIGLGGGHPGMQVHLLLVIAVYALLRAACSLDATSARSGGGAVAPSPWRRQLQALALVAGGLAIGTLLMAFMLIPEARGSHDTVGVLARQAGTLPPERLSRAVVKTVLFPDWWGRPSALETAGSFEALSGNFGERTFYAGVVAFLLACIGLISPGHRRRKAPFAVLGALGLAVALHAPGRHVAGDPCAARAVGPATAAELRVRARRRGARRVRLAGADQRAGRRPPASARPSRRAARRRLRRDESGSAAGRRRPHAHALRDGQGLCHADGRRILGRARAHEHRLVPAVHGRRRRRARARAIATPPASRDRGRDPRAGRGGCLPPSRTAFSRWGRRRRSSRR